jgi:hypothetical protein
MGEAEAKARCHQCGREATMYFHGLCAECCFDERDDDDDPEGPAFECHGFNDGSGFYCPLWGSEECDWECPNGGMLR